MTQSVLGSITMGYEPLWNQWRKRIGVRLWLDPESSSAVDAKHLIESLQELWPAPKEICLLHARSPGLLSDLLDHSTAHNIVHSTAHSIAHSIAHSTALFIPNCIRNRRC